MVKVVELESEDLDQVSGGYSFSELQADVAYGIGYVLGGMVKATVENPDFGPKW